MTKRKTTLGRPVKYSGPLAKHIVSMIVLHGATGARAKLNAPKRNKIANGRNHKLIPAKGLNISMPTLLKLASEGGVTLRQGRPRKAA